MTNALSIVEIDQANYNLYRQPLLALIAAQMQAIGCPKPLDLIEKALKNVLRPNAPAHLFLMLEKDQVIGFCLVNVNAGLQLGGDYAWINEIHIAEDKRQKGYGRHLLRHVEQ